MATIGTFKKTGNNEFNGEIVTLSLQTKNVRIVPEARATGENAPSHRVFVGRAEIGAAWSKTSNEGRAYLGLKLDDPSFNAPIYANLFDDEEGEGFSLIWSRPNGRRNGEYAQREAPPGQSGRGQTPDDEANHLRHPMLESRGKSQNRWPFQARTTIIAVVLALA